MSSSINPTIKKTPFQINLQTEKKGLTTYCVKWKIKDFLTYQRNTGSYIESPFFKTKTQSWSLQIYPNGVYDRDYVDVYLKSFFETKVFAIAKIYLINKYGERCHVKIVHKTFNGLDFGYTHFLFKSMLLAEQNVFLPNNCLTVLLELQVEDGNVLKRKRNCVKRKADWKPAELTRILNNTNLSDVTLTVGEKNFKLHKLILCARSPVFDAMFRHPMTETVSNNVNITDVSPAIMEDVIQYIYTSECPNLEENTEEIFAVANKYQLEGLKELCAKQLLSELNESNAAVMLALADFYNAIKFKEKIIDFISVNARNVLSSSSWNELVNSKNKVVDEVNSIIMEKYAIKTEVNKKNMCEENKKNMCEENKK